MDLEEKQSLYVSGFLAALGFSSREANIRRHTCKAWEFFNNLFLENDNYTSFCFHSGSVSEGVQGGNYYLGQQSDIDVNRLLKIVKVFDEKQESDIKKDSRPSYVPPIIVKEIPDKDYPGYVRLIVVRADPVHFNLMSYKEGQYYLPNTLITQLEIDHLGLRKESNTDLAFRKHQSTKLHVHGPAIIFKTPALERVLPVLSEVYNVSHDVLDQDKFLKSITFRYFDLVPCIQSMRKPYELTYFKKRTRPGLWPKKETVEYIVDSTPIFLAPIGHESSPDVDLQWRISFNVAEKLLMEDINETQMQCYALLKIFLKDILKLVSPNILSSYCMKTTMFWFSEREGRDNMVPEKLLHYFVQCLKLIQTWLESRIMPHYFIENRNVFPSNMDCDEVKELMHAIGKAILKPMSLLEHCISFQKLLAVSRGDPLFCPKYSARSYLNSWIDMRIGILEGIYDFVENLMPWIPYNTKNSFECIARFQHVVKGTQTFDYGQPLLKIFKSCLGFVCFANHSDVLETKKDKLSLKEIETLLLEGKDGDLTLCPLKLATFYLMENNICEVLNITTFVLQQRQKIQNKHNFLDMIVKKTIEHTHLLHSIEDMKTLEHLVDIVSANFVSKTHYHETVHSREDRAEVQQFLNFPTEVVEHMSFDVTFMLQDSSALPRAVRLEVAFSEPIQIDTAYCISFTISPLMYTFYIRFLAFKAILDIDGCIGTLSHFQELLPSATILNQSIGYNLLASCYSMMGNTHDSAKSFCCSLKINPTLNNVAFGYFAFVYNVLFPRKKNYQCYDLDF